MVHEFSFFFFFFGGGGGGGGGGDAKWAVVNSKLDVSSRQLTIAIYSLVPFVISSAPTRPEPTPVRIDSIVLLNILCSTECVTEPANSPATWFCNQ